MVQRIGGARRKTRYELKKSPRMRGKVSIRRMLQEFDVGDTVQLLAEPAVQRGMYFMRFHAKHGVIAGKRGKAYLVEIKDFHKKKQLIVLPVHLKLVSKVKR